MNVEETVVGKELSWASLNVVASAGVSVVLIDSISVSAR